MAAPVPAVPPASTPTPAWRSRAGRPVRPGTLPGQSPGGAPTRVGVLARLLHDVGIAAGWGTPACSMGADLPADLTPGGVDRGGAEGEPETEITACDLSDHPAVALAGWRAPRHWTVFGVCTEGRAWDLDRRDPSAPVRVKVTHVVDVAGQGCTLLSDEEDPTLVIEHPGGLGGRVDDTCRRVLDVPTPPPTSDSRALFALQWLDRLDADLDAGLLGTPTWDELARRHPVFDPIYRGNAGAELEAWAVEHLARAGDLLAERWSWAALREAAAAGRVDVGGIDRQLAAWLDEGAFSREVLGDLPVVATRFAEVRSRLEPGRARQIGHRLRRWGLLP